MCQAQKKTSLENNKRSAGHSGGLPSLPCAMHLYCKSSALKNQSTIETALGQMWSSNFAEPSEGIQISHDALLSGILRHTARFTKRICVLACIIGSAALFLTSARKSIRSCPLALCMPPVRDTHSGLSPFTPAVVILCR